MKVLFTPSTIAAYLFPSFSLPLTESTGRSWLAGLTCPGHVIHDKSALPNRAHKCSNMVPNVDCIHVSGNYC